MTKTPYEIRLDLISLAKDLLIDEYHTKREYVLEQWRNNREDTRAAGNVPVGAPKLPEFPTETDILRKAETLNTFVSKAK